MSRALGAAGGKALIEPQEAQAIAHAEPLGLPLQCLPLGAIAHEECLGARVLKQAGGRDQGANALLGSEPADEQDARPPDARERILERTFEEQGIHPRWDDVNAVLISAV